MHDLFSTSTGRMCHAIAMSAASALGICQRAMCLRVDFHANLTALEDYAKAALMNVTSGQSSTGSFAKLGPDLSWLKMSQGYSQVRLDGTLDAFSVSWPRQGMMQSGVCYQLAPWVPHIHESACSSYPTPSKSDGSGGASMREAVRALAREKRASGHNVQLRLNHYLSYLEDGGQPNPTFVEWLMGFPIGWTDLAPSATQLSPSALKSSDE